MGAAFVRDWPHMPRSKPVRLREAAGQPPRDADIIDAEFRVVAGRPRALGAVLKALIAVFWAAVIGFLIPPAWIFFESIGAYFAAQ